MNLPLLIFNIFLKAYLITGFHISSDDMFVEKKKANSFLKYSERDMDIAEFFQDDLNLPEIYSSSELFYARDTIPFIEKIFNMFMKKPWKFKLKDLRKLSNLPGNCNHANIIQCPNYEVFLFLF
jgi:hypothetical protein